MSPSLVVDNCFGASVSVSLRSDWFPALELPSISGPPRAVLPEYGREGMRWRLGMVKAKAKTLPRGIFIIILSF